MIVPYGAAPHAWMMRPTKRPNRPSSCKETLMKWETPEAIDMRYGMEITMYISNR